MLNRIFNYLLIILVFFACSKNPEYSGISKNNLEKKLDEAVQNSEKSENIDLGIEILKFIDDKELTFDICCINSKILYLRIAKNLSTDGYNLQKEPILKALQNKDCNTNSLNSYLYNFLGIYYQINKKPDSASIQFKKAIYEANLDLDKSAAVDPIFNIMASYVNQEKYDSVLKYSLKGIKTLENSKRKQNRKKLFYANAAWSYAILGDFETSKLQLAETEKILAEEKNKDFDEDFFKAKKKVLETYGIIYNKQKKIDLLLANIAKLDSINKKIEGERARKDYQNFQKEIQLKQDLLDSNDEMINAQRALLIFAILFLIIILLITLKLNKTRKNLELSLEQRELLYDKLELSWKELEDSNNQLIRQTNEIENLLKNNEQSLFSKTLRLSNYKDAINNVLNNLNKLIDKNSSISVSKLMFIDTSLKNILIEEDIWEDFKFEFEKSRPDFFTKLLEQNPKLSIIEQKHCAYVVTNLKSKEVATILNLSPRSVETARYRIKKKLDLQDESLFDFLRKL